jgi:hypothetical protein
MDRLDDVFLVEQLLCNILPHCDELDEISMVIERFYQGKKYSDIEYCKYDAETYKERLDRIRDIIKRIIWFKNPVQNKYNKAACLLDINSVDESVKVTENHERCMKEMKIKGDHENYAKRNKYTPKGRLIWYEQEILDFEYLEHRRERELESAILSMKPKGVNKECMRSPEVVINTVRSYCRYGHMFEDKTKEMDDKELYKHYEEIRDKEEEKYGVKPVGLSYFLDTVRDYIFKEKETDQ